MQTPHQTPQRKYLVIAAIVSSLGGLLFGFDTIVISGAIRYLTEHFHLNAAATGWAAGCALIGCIVGAASAGSVADFFGRKKALAACATCFAVSSLGIWFAGSLPQLRAAMLSYRGPSVRSLLANPPYPNFSLSQVVAVAEQYQGAPYVYGGASPAGFDCSGFTQFVYAQFGVALPHSASRQGAGGTAIAASAALPGDIVVMDGGGHVGIYLGGNMMIDAPEPGKVVQIRAIYSSSRWFVRYGI